MNGMDEKEEMMMSHHHGGGGREMDMMRGMSMYFTTGTMVTVWFEPWMTTSTTAYVMALFGLAAFGVFHEWLTSVRMKMKMHVQCIKMEMVDKAGRARERETLLQTPTTTIMTVTRAGDRNDVENMNMNDAETGAGAGAGGLEERPLFGNPSNGNGGGGDSTLSGTEKVGIHVRTKAGGKAMRWNLVAHEAGVSMLYMVNLIFSYLLMLAVMSYNVGVFFAVILGMTLGHFAFNASPQVPGGMTGSPDCRYKVGRHVYVDGNSSGDTCHPQN